MFTSIKPLKQEKTSGEGRGHEKGEGLSGVCPHLRSGGMGARELRAPAKPELQARAALSKSSTMTAPLHRPAASKASPPLAVSSGREGGMGEEERGFRLLSQ